MECIFCLCSSDFPTLSCKGYGCKRVACIDCVNVMIDVCTNSINSMPMCTCGCEYLASQLYVLPKESIEKYVRLCKKSNEAHPIPESKESRKAEKEAMLQMFAAVKSQTRKDIKEALPPAIAKLMIISGLESRLIEFNKKQNGRVVELPPSRRCASFTCKGALMEDENGEDDNILKCSSCSLLVCSTCTAVRSKSHHECRKDDVETQEMLKSISKCPSCGVPATRGEGCIFITCPFCNTNFDSKTGKKTRYGGHNNGEIRGKVEHTSLSDIVPDSDVSGKLLISKIENAKPVKPGSRRPDVLYEYSYNLKVYSATINRIYELRDSGRLNKDELTNIHAYLEML